MIRQELDRLASKIKKTGDLTLKDAHEIAKKLAKKDPTSNLKQLPGWN